MTDASEAPAPEGSAGRERRAGRLGRRIALGVYGICLAYMVVVGFNSVIRQVFFVEAPKAHALAQGACPAEIEALRASLFDNAAAHLRSAGEAPIDSWIAEWDTRALSASARCEGDALHSLMILRFRIETTLRRFDREEARLSDRILEQNEPSDASATSTPPR